MKSRANKQSGATIKDVAERAGVSAMTVSRVLNEAARVRPETRERVREAIARQLAWAGDVDIHVIPAQEERQIASDALNLMDRTQ